MPRSTVHGIIDGTWFPPVSIPVPSLPTFKAGDRVNLYPRVTGGCHKAIILRSRYSTFFECWTYDIKITSDRSAMWPKGHVEYGTTESQLGARR